MSRRTILFHKPDLKERARALRKRSTRSEQHLWQYLRKKQVRGQTFLRQRPIGCFIVDFYCPELKLAIEVDGSIHIGREQEDARRQKSLEGMGVHFLRFSADEVMNNVQSVIRTIEAWIDQETNTPQSSEAKKKR